MKKIADRIITPGQIYFEGFFPPRERGLLPSVKLTWDGRMIQMFTEDLEQGETDMRVLQHAPEMLGILRSFVEQFESSWGASNVYEQNKALTQAREVIKKIENR